MVPNYQIAIPRGYDWAGGIKDTLNKLNTASGMMDALGLGKASQWNASALAESARRLSEFGGPYRGLADLQMPLDRLLPNLTRNQTRYADVIGRAAWTVDHRALSRILEQQNTLAGGILGDLSTLGRIDTGELSSVSRALADRALGVVKAYDVYAGESLSALNKTAAMPLPDAARDLLYSGVATERHLRAVTDLVVSEAEEVPPEEPAQVEADVWRARAAGYEDVWEAFGPRFGRMWRGSWQTLYSDSEDAVRQAADSGREILSQILREMAPDDRFTPEEIARDGYRSSPTRVMRVRYIVKAGLGSDSCLDWAQAKAKALEEAYALMSRQSHGTEDAPRFRRGHVVGELEALGGFIRVLFECYRDIPRS